MRRLVRAFLQYMKNGRAMVAKRFPPRDPRTVAREIPGVLDILFPRLTGGLVASLNRATFSCSGVDPIDENLIEKSRLNKALLFEISVVFVEIRCSERRDSDWSECLTIAAKRQSQHYDAVIPDTLESHDIEIISRAADNLQRMIAVLQENKPSSALEIRPVVPGLGWIASGTGDFSIGETLIEVKNADRNFVAGDIRQTFMYWILKYALSLKSDSEAWKDCILINPRRNIYLNFDFDTLSRAASANLGRVELYELLRHLLGQELDIG